MSDGQNGQTTALAKASPLNTIAAFIDSHKAQIQQVMVKGMDINRITKIAIAAVSRNPQLLLSTPVSIYKAIHTGVQLGLEPGSPLGDAYLVPFWNSKVMHEGKRGAYEATFIPGYRGLLKLAYQSGSVLSAHAFVVHEGDKFELTYGLHPGITHVPAESMGVTRGALKAVYAVASVRDAEPTFRVLWKEDIDKVKNFVGKGKAIPDASPWVKWEEEMWLKTAFRKLCKWLPLRTDKDEGKRFAHALEVDDKAEGSVDWEPVLDTVTDDGDLTLGEGEQNSLPAASANPQTQTARETAELRKVVNTAKPRTKTENVNLAAIFDFADNAKDSASLQRAITTLETYASTFDHEQRTAAQMAIQAAEQRIGM